jgi:aerobic carbon-monoxide dehydrogenase medium subunit
MAGAEVVFPTSAAEAAAAFGDGTGVTVVGGGTIVMPEISYGRLRPEKTIVLSQAGLAGISRDGSSITIAAATPLADLVALPAPVGPCAANVADLEIRGQATLGGNVCAGESADAPRGDLQGALLAVGATARSAGAGGERSEPLEAFLDDRAGRLLLDVSFESPAAGAFVALDRPHTHDYTAMAVSAARSADGTVRVAVTGAGSHGQRLPSAESKADDPGAAGDAAVADVSPHDDAVASAWYRTKTLPVLVRRALAELKEAS